MSAQPAPADASVPKQPVSSYCDKLIPPAFITCALMLIAGFAMYGVGAAHTSLKVKWAYIVTPLQGVPWGWVLVFSLQEIVQEIHKRKLTQALKSLFWIALATAQIVLPALTIPGLLPVRLLSQIWLGVNLGAVALLVLYGSYDMYKMKQAGEQTISPYKELKRAEADLEAARTAEYNALIADTFNKETFQELKTKVKEQTERVRALRKQWDEFRRGGVSLEDPDGKNEVY